MFPTQTFHFTGYAAFQRDIKSFPCSPGVYRMLSKNGEILYVGKAKNLRNRLQSYAHFDGLSLRIQRLVVLISQVLVTTTTTEAEALLLEASWIRECRPRFNIDLKDDRSFPSVLMTQHLFPRIMTYRGRQPQAGTTFGPFLAAQHLEMMLEEIAKAFGVRTCSDHFFANRRRPCLRFYIKRCTAPCTGKISASAYNKNVQSVLDILRGKSNALQRELQKHMQEASATLHYELAGKYRDQIQAISKILTHQEIYQEGFGDVDIVVFASQGDRAGFSITAYRGDCFKGERLHFINQIEEQLSEEDLLPLLVNLYKTTPPPPQILLGNIPLSDEKSLARALSTLSPSPVKVSVPQRGAKAKILLKAVEQAQAALSKLSGIEAFNQKLFDGLAQIFSLRAPPRCIEVYDNSHMRGQFPFGVKISATSEGFQPKNYRRFRFSAAKLCTQDDYMLLRETLERRLQHAEEDPLPDLLLIDGGKGQLSTAQQVILELNLETPPDLIAIAKGPERNAGREHFFFLGIPGSIVELAGSDLDPPLLFFLQRLRDEAHRYAISSHRHARIQSLQRSKLDAIPGVGAHRKRALLRHFGSPAAVETASVEDLRRVEGIGPAQAREIFAYFRNER